MNIKNLMAGSMLSMLMASGMVAANWGDVYYCQMTHFDEITFGGEKKSWKLEKFKFKLNQAKKTLEFGSGGYFNNFSMDLVDVDYYFSHTVWNADSSNSKAYFQEGKFLTASVIFMGITSISADCDKF
tara:strand:- start:314 stop:697 length:384 start_codon:yes stop_codon:yes gene_type:complete